MTDTAELERLAASITPGPWVRDCWDILGIGDGNGTGAVCCVSYPNGDDDQYWKDGEADDNARAIALVPDLLAEVIALRAEVERLEACATAAEADADRLAKALDRVIDWTEWPLDRFGPIIQQAEFALADHTQRVNAKEGV